MTYYPNSACKLWTNRLTSINFLNSASIGFHNQIITVRDFRLTDFVFSHNCRCRAQNFSPHVLNFVLFCSFSCFVCARVGVRVCMWMNRYVTAGTAWLNGAFGKVAKVGNMAGAKTKEKFQLAVANLTVKVRPTITVFLYVIYRI